MYAHQGAARVQRLLLSRCVAAYDSNLAHILLQPPVYRFAADEVAAMAPEVLETTHVATWHHVPCFHVASWSQICSSDQLSMRPLTQIQGAKHHLTIDAIMCVQHKHRTCISTPDWMGSHWQPMPPCHWQAMQMTTMTSPSHCMKALFLHKVIKLQA